MSSPNEVSSRDMNQNKKLTYQDCLVWTALITPFDEHHQVDYQQLTILAQQQADAGNGILLLGSTGESLSLTVEEQLTIVKAVCELALAVPIMVGIGGYNVAQQKQMLSDCNQLAVDAYLLGATLYAKPNAHGQQMWYQALLDEADKPCMLYNVPSRSGINLSVEALANLQQHPNCWALKEASGQIEQFIQYRKHCPQVSLYSGEDALMPVLQSVGAKGLVSVAANVWPQQTHRYVEHCLHGNTQSVFPVWHDAVQALFDVANPIPVKALMHLKGLIKTPELRLPLSANDLTAIEPLQLADQQIQQWHLSQSSLRQSA